MPDALTVRDSYVVRVAAHVRGEADGFGPRLREVAYDVAPALRLYDVLSLDLPVDEVNRSERLISRFSASLTALLGVIAVLISIAGIYSVMSFTVARQTREIGVRVALGADRRRIMSGVFSRALAQIGIGVTVGGLIGTVVWGALIGGEPGVLPGTVIALVLIGLVACGVPMRRALGIAPTEALRDAG